MYETVAPPLGRPLRNNFLMYTDALVINKALLNDETKSDIDTFIQFYSDLSTRLHIAFGDDLPYPHPPRYLMQAREDFYAESRVEEDQIYMSLQHMLKHAVAAPNAKLYGRKDKMKVDIMNALDNKDLEVCDAQCALADERA